MLLCVMGVGFENTCTVSGKWNEDVGSVQDFIFWFCFWFKSRELEGRMSLRFLCVTPVMESFSSDLLQAIISYWTGSHLESYQTSMMQLFCENSQRLKMSTFSAKNSTTDVRLDSKSASDWKDTVNVGVGRLQVHGICSCRLVRRELVETRSSCKRTWHVW